MAVGTVVVFAVAFSTGLFFFLLFRFSFSFLSSSVFRLVLEADVGKGICGRSSVGAVKDCRNVCSQSEDEDEEDANNSHDDVVGESEASTTVVARIEDGVVTAAAAGGGRRSPPISIIIAAVMANRATIGPSVGRSRKGTDNDRSVV